MKYFYNFTLLDYRQKKNNTNVSPYDVSETKLKCRCCDLTQTNLIIIRCVQDLSNLSFFPGSLTSDSSCKRSRQVTFQLHSALSTLSINKDIADLVV